MKEKISPVEAAKAFFDAKEYSGSTKALFHASLKYGTRRNKRLKELEKRNKTIKGL